jgi:endonuclease/exonuclease/phosphatase family metal-dependent hydrolase
MKIRVGTFNLFQFVEPPYAWYNKKDKFSTEQWHEKYSWIKNQILKMDCHIIGFQEVFSKDALESLVKEQGFNYFETVDVAKLSINDQTKYISTTVAIASKYPIVNIEEVKEDFSRMEKYKLEEPFLFSRVPIKATISLSKKQDILVYVSHLKSNRLNEFEYLFNKTHTLEHKQEVVSKTLVGKYSKALKQRLAEASSLFFDIEKSNKLPTLLLCDLNDKEFSLTIDALTNKKYHSSSKEGLLLHDASYAYKDIGSNPHPEAKEPKRKSTSYFLGKGNVLDYIFISRHFELTNYVVLDEHLHVHGNNLLLQSDHAQVICELSLKKEETK